MVPTTVNFQTSAVILVCLVNLIFLALPQVLVLERAEGFLQFRSSSVSGCGRGVSGLWGEADFPGQVLAAVETLLLVTPSSPSVSGHGTEVSGPWGQNGSQVKLLVVVGSILLVPLSYPMLGLLVEREGSGLVGRRARFLATYDQLRSQLIPFTSSAGLSQ